MKRILIALCMMLSAWTMHAQLNTDRITAIGRNALYFEDYVLSIQYFNQVIKIKPYLAEPYIYRAIAKTQLGDYAGAERDCSQAIERNPFLPGAYYTRGYIRRQQERYQEAEDDLTRALEFAPENKSYIINRADARAHLQKYDEAIADLDALLRKEPKAAELHFEKGVICMEKKDTACAKETFENAAKYDPRNPTGWSAIGYVNMAMQQDDQAMENLTKAIDLGSKWAGDYMNRGVLYYKQHNYRNALADYDQAVENGKQDAQCYYNRGLLRAEVGDYNNALTDFDQALDLQPNSPETHYQRGVVHLQLRHWSAALADFDTLTMQYPYFLPAYYLAAQAANGIGNQKLAYTYQRKAYELEKNKDAIRKQRSAINTDAKIAKNQPAERDFRKEFSNRAAQNMAENDDQKYDDNLRGTVQKRYADVVNEPNFALSYYNRPDNLRRTNLYHPLLEQYNQKHTLPAQLKITCQETSLPSELISQHFEAIDRLSARIDSDLENADLYFARALEFALVQDFNSAIEDLNRAITLRNDFTLAYFCRANLRYKLLEYVSNTDDLSAVADVPTDNTVQVRNTTRPTTTLTAEKRYAFDFELIMRDYEQVLKLAPDFSYAWYNKANILCTQKDYKGAIEHYSRAIAADPEMAESYFNRGLTLIYTNQVQEGVADLSKAGELGIYQAYNLITRFQ